jgi:hypothetical protein
VTDQYGLCITCGRSERRHEGHAEWCESTAERNRVENRATAERRASLSLVPGLA